MTVCLIPDGAREVAHRFLSVRYHCVKMRHLCHIGRLGERVMCGCGGGSGATSSGSAGSAGRGGQRYAVIANGYRVFYNSHESALKAKQAMDRRGQTGAQVKKIIPGAKKR